MNTLLKSIASFIVALSLVACGGSDPSGSTQSQQAVRLGAKVQGDAPRAATEYYEVVQELYISYFGRPADSSGLANFAAQLSQLNAPNEIQALNSAYSSNSSIRGLVDSFGDSNESKTLYSGDNAAFVNAIYQNLLSRTPDADGQAFWVNSINGGGLTRADASLSIMAGALINQSTQGLLDAQLIRNRVAVGLAFTSAVNAASASNAYAGDAAAATVRAMLASVTANTDVNAFQGTINSTIATLVANAAPPVPQVPSYATIRGILNTRCISCHSGSGAQAGIRLDNDAVVHSVAQDIYTQVVVTRAMPFGNATGMTDAERDTVKAWFQGGAQ